MTTDLRDSDDPAANSKVGRVIETYDLAGLGAELEALWTGEGDERHSLRDLADVFNQRVLKSAMEETGMTPTDPDVEHIYNVLDNDDVSGGIRIQKRRELEREGIDIDDLESNFVSHQAIHTYLRKFRGAEYESGDDRDQIVKDVETLQRLQSRTAAVTGRTLERLSNTERIETGSLDVYVDVRAICEECGADMDAVDIIENGGCECADGE